MTSSLHRSTIALLLATTTLTFACSDDISEAETASSAESGSETAETDTADTESTSNDEVGESESTSGTDTDTDTDTETESTSETDTTAETDTESGSETAESESGSETAESESGSETAETDTTTGEEESETGSVGGPCDGGCGLPDCGACPSGPSLVDIGSTSIDSTEVTNSQYQYFMSVEFTEAGLAEILPETCSWKDDPDEFIPDNFPVEPNPDLPVTGVDWCDAYAYCAWSGRRLCGNTNGSAAEFSDVQNPANNEWYKACTQGGVKNYPYGLLYDEDACNGEEAGYGQLLHVGSLATCDGGYSGIYDMSGNVWEWTNACGSDDVDDEDQTCRRRGGSYFSDGPTLRCGIDSKRARNFRNIDTGFRCCDEG
ncbi:formylglycine-generating enzyme family protein [Pseudenhygromyxa sp. WMMC2535]|uniref:formylglycine-generating enzyme family protein n=1 Tax=Pseudenhygromyxa sp. WMMC2535 TaxID=2712867 RepID=UPI0015530F82|nr:formylglycine-generating enzyme family protein [Pseudenhygromyxa sp. WMMC2535]NVB42897.1 formylglycine-generating enzyme family protein [Pseudenhygromyxa sp. WMMC2535]